MLPNLFPPGITVRGIVDGGCEDCNAYQDLTVKAPKTWILEVVHNEGCPFLKVLKDKL